MASQLSFALDAPRRAFAVSELNSALQQVLQRDFTGISVSGEISGCRAAGSGHYYFSLKDERSQIKAVLFKGTARYVRFKPQDGLAVIARGNLEVYEARGEYQLIVEALEPQGAGALQIAFEQLKKKLSAEGLFDAARKRKLPALPRRIGVVTSPSGAVIRDILHVLARRFPGLHIRLFPAQVQGEGSIEQVCSGIDYFSRIEWAEVVIVARGGGSLEDLWTFNEERVARAVAASRIPVVSAIGHETDFTICDFVADLRAPTPSAAAEMVICTRESLLDQITVAEKHLLQSIRYRLLRCTRDLNQKGSERAGALLHRMVSRSAQRLDDLDQQLRRTEQNLIGIRQKRLRDINARLEANRLGVRLARVRARLDMLDERMRGAVRTGIARGRRRQETLEAHVQQLSPVAVLSRGYAILLKPGGKVVRSAGETEAGEELSARLHDGTVRLRTLG